MSALPLAAAAALVLCQAEPSRVKASGYLSERVSLSAGWDTADPTSPGLAQMTGMPLAASLTEANAQLRLPFAEGWDAYTDLSIFVSAQSDPGGRLPAGPATSARVEVAEAYLNLGFAEHLNGLVGRKRTVWGSGFALNPADLIDPRKDPTDPTLQRSGAWMARLEAPFQHFTLTALWAPKVTGTSLGLPTRFLFEPGGREAQQLFAVRAYALLADSDVNLMWFWSNRYADTLPHSHRFAASFSRYFFTDYEFHVEATLQRGRDTAIVDPSCMPRGGSFQAMEDCQAAGRPLMASTGQSDPGAYYARVLVGARTSFKDESLLSVEYFFNGTGLDAAQFEDRARLFDLLPALWDLALERGLTVDPTAALGTSGAGSADGAPLRLDLTTVRRHYLLLVYQKPRIAEDFTASLTTVVGLEGPSALFAPSLTWSAREWLSLGLYAFLPVGSDASEYGALPLRFRALLEARAYY